MSTCLTSHSLVLFSCMICSLLLCNVNTSVYLTHKVITDAMTDNGDRDDLHIRYRMILKDTNVKTYLYI